MEQQKFEQLVDACASEFRRQRKLMEKYTDSVLAHAFVKLALEAEQRRATFNVMARADVISAGCFVELSDRFMGR